MKKGQKRIWIAFAVGLALLLSGCGAKNQPVSATQVYLEEGQVSLQGPGAVYDQDNGQVTIDQGGSYELSGSTEGIRFLINLEDPEPVKLILNGVNLTCPSPPTVWAFWPAMYPWRMEAFPCLPRGQRLKFWNDQKAGRRRKRK